MKKTFYKLEKHFEETNPHKIIPGRKSRYAIPDAIDKGRWMLSTNKKESEDDETEVEASINMEDVVVELFS